MACKLFKTRQKPVMRHKTRVCRYRGVSTHKQSGKWVAQIKSGGKQVYLGFYSDQEDAARAYDQAIIHMQVRLLAFLNPKCPYQSIRRFRLIFVIFSSH